MTSAAPLCAGAERRRRPPAGGAGTWSWDISTKSDDFDSYLAQLESAGYERNEVTCFTAHQMGSCRMGSDPPPQWPTAAASSTTPPASGSATPQPSRRPRASTRWSRSWRWRTGPRTNCWPESPHLPLELLHRVLLRGAAPQLGGTSPRGGAFDRHAVHGRLDEARDHEPGRVVEVEYPDPPDEAVRVVIEVGGIHQRRVGRLVGAHEERAPRDEDLALAARGRRHRGAG